MDTGGDFTDMKELQISKYANTLKCKLDEQTKSIAKVIDNAKNYSRLKIDNTELEKISDSRDMLKFLYDRLYIALAIEDNNDIKEKDTTQIQISCIDECVDSIRKLRPKLLELHKSFDDHIGYIASDDYKKNIEGKDKAIEELHITNSFIASFLLLFSEVGSTLDKVLIALD